MLSKYGVRGTDCHEIHNYSVVLWGGLLCRISHKSIENCGKNPVRQSVTVTEAIFTKLALARRLFEMKF